MQTILVICLIIVAMYIADWLISLLDESATMESVEYRADYGDEYMSGKE